MGRLIDVSWPELNVAVVAELEDERNPELCEEFWQHLPFKVMQGHPVVSGQAMYSWTPIASIAPVRFKERIDRAPLGRLRYSQATGNKFSVQYGRMLEPLEHAVLGLVKEEYLHLLPDVGRQVWENVFWRKGDVFVEVKPHDPTQAYAGPSRYDGLTGAAAEFYAEAKRVQTVEPEELKNIRLGRLGDTGSYGQYFTAWDIANGMLRDYTMYTIYPLLKLVDKLSVDDFRTCLQEFDPAYSDYLGYSGMTTLERFAKMLRNEIAKTNNKEAIKLLLQTFLLYVNRLNAWSFHYFPWHIGTFYGREVKGQELPGRWTPEG